MKPASKVLLSAFVIALFVAMTATAQPGQGQHPAYLHAISDLRTARALLHRPDGGELHEQEKKAQHELSDAIDAIKKAAIDDGKDLNYEPPVDARMDWPGRLHRALELINKAHSDISREEDNQFAQGLQERALGHIDKARHHVQEAIELIR
jgi:tetratricopeptide (TPR) repeat protein